jgi:hypothetical protein
VTEKTWPNASGGFRAQDEATHPESGMSCEKAEKWWCETRKREPSAVWGENGKHDNHKRRKEPGQYFTALEVFVSLPVRRCEGIVRLPCRRSSSSPSCASRLQTRHIICNSASCCCRMRIAILEPRSLHRRVQSYAIKMSSRG